MLNLLIIEDDNNHLMLTKKYLQQPEYKGNITIYTAKSLKESRKEISEKDIDCIILDLGLSDSEGLETVEKLNIILLELKKNIPIIIYTILEDYNLARQAFKIGVKQFLIKGEAEAKEIIRILNSIELNNSLPHQKKTISSKKLI